MEENKVVEIIDRANEELLAMKRNRISKINYENAYMQGYEDCYDFFCKLIDKKED